MSRDPPPLERAVGYRFSWIELSCRREPKCSSLHECDRSCFEPPNAVRTVGFEDEGDRR